jgi:hypothetical protein
MANVHADSVRPHSATDSLHHLRSWEHAKAAETEVHNGLGDSLEARIQPSPHVAESEVWSGGRSMVGWAPDACVDDPRDYQLQEISDRDQCRRYFPATAGCSHHRCSHHVRPASGSSLLHTSREGPKFGRDQVRLAEDGWLC